MQGKRLNSGENEYATQKIHNRQAGCSNLDLMKPLQKPGKYINHFPNFNVAAMRLREEKQALGDPLQGGAWLAAGKEA